MSKKTYKTISAVACAIAVIGLISLAGGARAVNPGVFIFPAAISTVTFLAYKKKKQ